MKTSIKDLPFSEADIKITETIGSSIVFELRHTAEKFRIHRPVVSKTNLNRWKEEYIKVGTKMHVTVNILAKGTGGEYGMLIVDYLYDDEGIPIDYEELVPEVSSVAERVKEEPTLMVSVTEEVMVKQSVDIDIYSLTDSHLDDMNRPALINVIKFLIAAHNGTAHELMDSGKANLVDDDHVDVDVGSGEPGRSVFDHKIGKTSKYKYVYFDNARANNSARWRWQVGKKTGSNVSEQIAALLVDEYLDSIDDDKRSRNRDEFPEIMAIHVAAIKNKRLKDM